MKRIPELQRSRLETVLMPSQMETLKNNYEVLVKAYNGEIFVLESTFTLSLTECSIDRRGNLVPFELICASWLPSDRYYEGAVFDYVYSVVVTLLAKNGVDEIRRNGTTYQFSPNKATLKVWQNKTVFFRQTLIDYGLV